MPIELTPDEVLGHHEKFLIYGPPGAGKTFLALTAPDPIYALTIGGRNELKTRYSKHFLDRYPEKVIYFDEVKEDREDGWEVKDNPTGLDQVKRMLDAFYEWNFKEDRGIQTVIIDNATTLEELQLNKAIAAEYAMAGNKAKTALRAERDWGIRRPHDSTWSGAQSLMDKFVNYIFELPFHVVFVAHERQEWEQIEKTRQRQLVKVLPAFIGQQRTSIPRAFDNVWRMQQEGGGRNAQFSCQTVGDEIVLAKTRVGGILEPVERNLDLTEVINEFVKYPKTLKRP